MTHSPKPNTAENVEDRIIKLYDGLYEKYDDDKVIAAVSADLGALFASFGETNFMFPDLTLGAELIGSVTELVNPYNPVQRSAVEAMARFYTKLEKVTKGAQDVPASDDRQRGG